MPPYGQFKKAVLGVLLGGTVLYGAAKINDLERRISVAENNAGGVENRVDALFSEVRVQKVVCVDRFRCVETVVRPLSEINAGVQRVLNATVRVNVLQGDRLEGYGSGVVLQSLAKDGVFVNYVLSAAHLVVSEEMPVVPTNTGIIVDSYVDAVPYLSFPASVRALHRENDWAIFSFESVEQLPVVKVASEVVLPSLGLFSELYTIGCPLALPPVRTRGELFAKGQSTGRHFWLTTVVGTLGNSGGGVYHAGNDELVGVLSSSGTIQYNVLGVLDFDISVPHTVLISPLTGFSEWLEKENLDVLSKKE